MNATDSAAAKTATLAAIAADRATLIARLADLELFAKGGDWTTLADLTDEALDACAEALADAVTFATNATDALEITGIA